LCVSLSWYCRKRGRDGAKRDEYRKPRGMEAAERAMRKYCESKADGVKAKYIFEPYVGRVFDPEAEAIEFYIYRMYKGSPQGSNACYLQPVCTDLAYLHVY
jgi:hypothetical protein